MAERGKPEILVRQQRIPKFIVDVLAWYAIRELRIENLDNLALAAEMKKQGNSVQFHINHGSHADGVVEERAFVSAGYEEFARDNLFVMGSKIKGHFLTNYLSHAKEGVVVPAKELNAVDMQESEFIADWKESSLAEIARFQAEGKNLTNFPTGTRKDEMARAGSARLIFLNDNTYVVPMFLQGPSEILPYKAWIPRRKNVIVVFGRPTSNKEYLERIGEYHDLKERNIKVTTEILNDIEALRPGS